MNRFAVTSICLFAFLLCDENILGVWLKEGDMSFLIFRDDN